MNTVGNVIWVVFGGFLIAVEYIISGLLMMFTIVGIPFGLQAFKLAGLALFPFGKKVRKNPANTGCLSMFMNFVWLILGGFVICLSHLLFGLIFFITIIGIPFGRQHFKLAGLALTPFGRDIV